MTSHGKVILFGEHAVVHGYPAIVSSLLLETKATIQYETEYLPRSPFIENLFSIFSKRYNKSVDTLNVTIESELPIGSGLGSSAATADAVFQSLLNHFSISYSKEEILDLVYESEKFAHGNPSGLDPTAVVYGGVLRFQKKEGKLTHSSIKTNSLKDKTFFLIQSGIPLENTKAMIERVDNIIKNEPTKKQILNQIGILTQQVIQELEEDRFIPDRITQNEKLLEELGVVGKIAEQIITDVSLIGGVAKVSGAGGYVQGSGVVLAYHDDPSKLEELLTRNKWVYYKTKLGINL